MSLETKNCPIKTHNHRLVSTRLSCMRTCRERLFQKKFDLRSWVFWRNNHAEPTDWVWGLGWRMWFTISLSLSRLEPIHSSPTLLNEKQAHHQGSSRYFVTIDESNVHPFIPASTCLPHLSFIAWMQSLMTGIPAVSARNSSLKSWMTERSERWLASTVLWSLAWS